MATPFSNELDEAAYLADHPEAREAESAYEHLIASQPAGELGRYAKSSLDPTVTIVVPAYNCARWLGYTLESIRRQSYDAWECIVVDDFSTDDTLRVIKTYLAKDDRFQLLSHRANGGLSAARNSGIRSARGAYICFLDSDDLMMRTSVATRLRALQSADDERLAGAYSASQTIDEGVTEAPNPSQARGMKVIDFITAAGMCPFNANQPMFKTSVLRTLGGFDQRLRQAEDWELWLRMLRHGYYVVPTGSTDVTYRMRAQSMVRTDPIAHLEVALGIYDGAHATLPEHKVYDDAPFVYRKPWISYKRQLDMSRRVLEFYAMAMSAEKVNGKAHELPARTLPDFFGAIVPHRDLANALRAGVKRQMVGATDEASRYLSQILVNKFLASFKAADTDDGEGEVVGEYPPDLGLDPGIQRDTDVLFLPHKDYHVWSFSLILDRLRDAGISYSFVDLGCVYRDEGAERKLDELGLPRVSYNELLLGNFRPKMVVCMNDWDPIVRRIVQSCQSLGIPTVGVVEGVQDYHDADTGRVRATYQTVDWVLLPGEFDSRYFDDADRVRVGGVPRIDELLRESNAFPKRPLVVINSNFTYNVLTEHRDEWVRMAVEASRELGYDYLISRHPADKGDFSAYDVADESMYDLIRRGSVFVSRFGSGILESLAMGKPALYFNPHGEKVDKFTEPNGAFPISASYDQLLRDLKTTVDDPHRYLKHAADYVELHCGTRVDSDVTAAERLATEMLDIYRSADIPPDERRSRLKYLLIHRDEQLLGPVKLAGGGLLEDLRRGNGMGRSSWSLPRGGPRVSVEERTQRLSRKYRKLKRDPKAFFEDSRFRPLNLLKHLF